MSKTRFFEYFKKKKLSSNDNAENSVTKVVTPVTQNISNAEVSFVSRVMKSNYARWRHTPSY